MTLIQKILTQLQPEGRGMATAATFEQFIDFTGISMPHLKAALEYLSQSKGEDEEGRVEARRKTCAEVAALIDGPSAMHAIKVRDHWADWATHCERESMKAEDEGFTKARLIAMAETARREQGELQDLIA